MRYLILTAVLLIGCDTLESTADDVLTRGPEGEPSQAERVVDSTGWLIPSPWRELAVAVTGGLAGFWTARRKGKETGKA